MDQPANFLGVLRTHTPSIVGTYITVAPYRPQTSSPIVLIAGADPQGRKTRTDLQGLNVIYRGTQDGINATPLEAVTEIQVNPRIISIQHREGTTDQVNRRIE